MAASAEGIDLDTVGVIRMIVGGNRLLASMLFWSSFSPYGRGRDRVIVRERDVI